MKPISHPGLRVPHPGLSVLLLALAFSAITFATTRAQVPSPQPPPPSYTVFPLGGLTSGLNPDSTIVNNGLPKFGLNMLYNGNPGVLQIKADVLSEFYLPTGTFGIGYNPLFAEADFHLASNETGLSAWDLASTLDPGSDSAFWGLTTGKLDSNDEWFIGGPPQQTDLSPAHPGYYLWGLDSNVHTGSQIADIESSIGTNDSTMNNGAFLPGVRCPQFYIDFAYRLDAGTYMGASDTAYDLEVNVKWRDGSTVLSNAIQYSVDDGTTWIPGTSVIIDSETGDYEIPIGYADYKNFVGVVKNPNQDLSSHPSENPNLLAFPNPILTKFSAEPYAVLRIAVTCNGKVLQEGPVCPITVNLKGSDPKGIYVRGVRIRSEYADNLYRGLYDAKPVYLLQPNDMIDSGVVLCPPLDSMFATIRANLSSRDWKNALAFNVGNECTWMAWRAFAYINERFRAYSNGKGGIQKDFNTIVTGGQNLAFWRPIYEDESKTNASPPPALQNESIAFGQGYQWYNPDGQQDQLICRPDHDFLPRYHYFGGSTSPLSASDFTWGDTYSGMIFPGDAIPSEVKNHTGFDEFGLTITGYNGGPTYDSTKILPSSDSDNYTTYTYRYWLADTGIGANEMTAAETSYPQDQFPQPNRPSTWTVYYTYPTVFADAVPAGCWPLIEHNLRSALYSDLKSNIPVPGSIPYSQLSSYVPTPPVWSDTTLYKIGDWVSYTGTCNCTYKYWVCVAPPPVGIAPSESDGACGWDASCSRSVFWQPTLTCLGDYFRFSIRPSTREEIREQTWNGVCWGAKGIIYNPMGDDGGNNIGFCGNNFENTVNSGFSNVSNNDSITSPLVGIAPAWNSSQQYTIGNWVTDKSQQWVSIYPSTNQEPPNARYWSTGFTYSEFPSVAFRPPDNVIPFRTPANTDTATTFPDRYVHWVDAGDTIQWYAKRWVPSLSDYDIYDGKGNVAISKGAALTKENMNEYILAVQHWSAGDTGWIPSSETVDTNLRNYYGTSSSTGGTFTAEWPTGTVLDTNTAQHPPNGPYWEPEANGGGSALTNADGPPGVSGWLSFDRRLDSVTPWRWPSAWPIWWDAPVFYPKPSFPFNVTSVPTYYGIKDRSDGVKRSMADLAPVAQELKNLQWVTTYDYADIKSSDTQRKAWATGKNANGSPHDDGPHPTGDLESPLAIDTSSQVQQQYNPSTHTFPSTSVPFTKSIATDDTSAMDYHVGVFHDPNDSGAFYVSIANRRTWPINYNTNHTAVISQDTTTASHYYYLGAIDARIVDLKLKPKNAWDDYTGRPVDWTGYQYFTITNVRTGTSSVGKISTGELTTGKDYELELDPGEGTLLRIAPSSSVELGRTPYAGMAYNNGHRICDISDPCHPHDHGIVWEDRGKIMFCRTQNENATPGPVGTFEAMDSTIYTVQTIYNPSGNHEKDGHNPSIAAHGDTVAIAYSVDDFADASQKPRSVVVAVSDTAHHYAYWTVRTLKSSLPYSTPLVSDISGNVPGTATAYDLLTPSITPSIDGFIAAFTSAALGIQAYLFKLKDSSVHLMMNTPGPPSPGQYRMVSLASRPEIRHDPINGNGEMIDMAWEMDNPDSTSDIEYQPYLHIPGDTVLHSFDNLGWTKVSVACANFHPMVAVKPPVADSFGMPVVTWESYHKANVREMTLWNSAASLTAWIPRWSPVKMFTPQASGSWIASNLPLPQVRIENALCSGYALPLQKELIYQDTFNHFERIHRYEPNAKGKYDWTSETKLREYAQQGSVSMPYGGLSPAAPDLDSAQDPGIMTYRGIWADDSNEFAVNIVTSPPAEQSIPTVIVPTFKFGLLSSQFVPTDCWGTAIWIGVGPATLQRLDTGTAAPPDTGGIRWNESNIVNYTTTPINDSQSVLTDSVWPITQDSVRTGYFSAASAFGIDMNRLLQVDTTQLDSLLPNASHWISYKLVVKDSASGAITQTIDSALVTGSTSHGYVNEPGVDPNDTMIAGQGYRIWNTINPTPSGSAYLTIVITKDSLTQAAFDETDIYCDSLALPIPSYDTSSTDTGGAPPPRAMAPDTNNVIPSQEPSGPSIDSVAAMAVNTTSQAFGTNGQAGPTASSPNENATSSEALDNAQAGEHSTGSQLPILDVTVHPNPVRGTVRICVADLPPGIPAVVDVVNDLGERVAKLYDAIPDAELGLCLSLDCSQLSAGVYYADLQAEGTHRAVEFTVEH